MAKMKNKYILLKEKFKQLDRQNKQNKWSMNFLKKMQTMTNNIDLN